MVTVRKITRPPSVARVMGFTMGFLTAGICSLRLVEPFELLGRSLSVGVLTWFVTNQFVWLWDRMTEDSLEEQEDKGA
ncbi:MAG: hypothetical protein KDA81_17870 [Planctomycetaceae bacterium]|nr:hypothetical protein [Planctomycetaceae bacterium]